ncbi:MAG: HAD family hydrolase [Selenomonadaceae bacterium]|nr:HAD family hydrolase [Selenomonadaceae bacterium]
MSNKAIFFDRDGTLNVNTDYLYKKEDFIWMPDAVKAIKYANDHGYLVIVVTNQSGIARGYYTEHDVKILHEWMNSELKKKGAHIDAFYYCPYHTAGTVPEYTKDSEDRKPKPGMVLKAIAEFDIDPQQSLMIGDKPLDVECAENAGVKGVLYDGSSLLDCLSTHIE